MGNINGFLGQTMTS